MFGKNRCFDKSMNFINDATINYNEMEYPTMQNQMVNPSCEMPPVYECPKERVCHREIVHIVPHICPVNTRIVNHHIYKHTYSPCYTCCEENVCSDVYEGNCCNF